MNPYRGLPSHQFWSSGVTLVRPGGLDPVTEGHIIHPGDKVATIGSCFAQHLAKHISSIGLNYYVVEAAPAEMSAEDALKKNYAIFSARYGNVYTARQALQLFDRSFGKFSPIEDVWQKGDGFVDAFRPQIQTPYATENEVRQAAEEHLKYVRKMFETADWLIFTLGLTEAWRSKLDGAVYPVAPGVAGGNFDPDRHEFINFSYLDVRQDMEILIKKLAHINPTCRVLLTVSPVALIATYEPRHVLVSTVASKAILRSVADDLERSFEQVVYFPSYEIITSPASEGRYYADDLREVTDVGVKHVMRTFQRHFVESSRDSYSSSHREISAPTSIESNSHNVICDEELIIKSLSAS